MEFSGILLQDIHNFSVAFLLVNVLGCQDQNHAETWDQRPQAPDVLSPVVKCQKVLGTTESGHLKILVGIQEFLATSVQTFQTRSLGVLP